MLFPSRERSGVTVLPGDHLPRYILTRGNDLPIIVTCDTGIQILCLSDVNPASDFRSDSIYDVMHEPTGRSLRCCWAATDLPLSAVPRNGGISGDPDGPRLCGI